jgi:hypothetical protein
MESFRRIKVESSSRLSSQPAGSETVVRDCGDSSVNGEGREELAIIQGMIDWD